MPEYGHTPRPAIGPAAALVLRGQRRRPEWSREPHHRRRRLLAGVLVLLLVVVILIAAGSGGSAAAAGRRPHRRYFDPDPDARRKRPGSFAGVERAAQNAAINRTLAYTPAIRVAGSQHREIALTFDDGPGPYTPQVVSVLERVHVPATFFEVGVAEQYFHAGTRRSSPAATRSATTPGRTRRCRSSRLRTSASQLLSRRTRSASRRAVPAAVPPAVRALERDDARALKQYRMLMVMWTVDTSDYRVPGVDAIIQRSSSAALGPGRSS